MVMCCFAMELPSVSHQPKPFDFPKSSFGKKVIVKRSFQASWFDRWSWVHYIALMSAVCKLLSLVLVMPAASERFFSCLRRLKSCLRATTQSRLNNVMVLHVHKNLTD